MFKGVAWCGFGRGFFAFVLAAATVAATAQAQEWSRLLPSETPERLSFIDRWEARVGFFDHDLPGPEGKTFDLQGTIVTPRPRFADAGAWNMVLPRAQIGGFYNLSGRTSAVFIDALWTIPVTDLLFAEIFVGPSVHDGRMHNTAMMAGLGCPVLVHAGASLGFHLTPQVSVMATYAHMSNAKALSNCPQNQGLDNIGLQIAHSF